jgi:zinc protease
MIRAVVPRAAAAVLAIAAVVVAVARPALAVDRSSPPPLAPVVPFSMPVPSTFTMKNGLRVYFVERHRAPLVDIVVAVHNGAVDDARGREGEAGALASLLTQGAGDRDAFAFSDATDRLGARIDADADLTATTISLHVASARLDGALPLLADAVLRPRLTSEDWNRKRDEMLGGLAYLRDDPRALASLAGARALFGPGRLGTASMGTGRSLSSTTIDHLRAMHSRRFRPDNAFVVVVGDVAPGALLVALEKNFGAWTSPPVPLPTRREASRYASDTGVMPIPEFAHEEATPPQGVRVVVVDRPGAPQSTIAVVATVPRDLQPFDPAGAVMQTLLGGSFTSRLNSNLREEHGYSYGAGYNVEVWPVHRSAVSTSVATPDTVPALLEIEKELARIREPATDDEVARARAYEALTFPGLLDGGASIAHSFASWIEQGISFNVVSAYTARVLAVDKAAVQVAARRLVDPGRMIIVVVGDVDVDALARFGPVTRMSADDLLPMPAQPR